MQIFALEETRLTTAHTADKKKNYTCPACHGPLRLKSGPSITAHFYHLNKHACSREKKGLVHLKLQFHLQRILGPGTQMEKPFPVIKRIGDVCHHNTVYEIQYSPMSLAEAKARTRDYESLGMTLIWILHDKTFRPESPNQTQQFLRTQTCYFTNMDPDGDGIIYDYLPVFGKRPINLQFMRPLPARTFPEPLRMRGKSWQHYHEGDFFDLFLQKKLILLKHNKPTLGHRLKAGYLTLLHWLLRD